MGDGQSSALREADAVADGAGNVSGVGAGQRGLQRSRVGGRVKAVDVRAVGGIHPEDNRKDALGKMGGVEHHKRYRHALEIAAQRIADAEGDLVAKAVASNAQLGARKQEVHEHRRGAERVRRTTFLPCAQAARGSAGGEAAAGTVQRGGAGGGEREQGEREAASHGGAEHHWPASLRRAGVGLQGA